MIYLDLETDRLIIDEEPRLVRFESEIFIFVSKRGYTPAVKIYAVKTKKRHTLLLAAQSISEQLEPMRLANNGDLLGIELWIRKAGVEKTSKYILEE